MSYKGKRELPPAYKGKRFWQKFRGWVTGVGLITLFVAVGVGLGRWAL